MKQLEKKMDEKNGRFEKVHVVIFLHTLDERLPKGDIKTQGNHENMEEINIESHNHDYYHLHINIIEGSMSHQGTTQFPRLIQGSLMAKIL
jgi:hypothetical protein